MIAASLHDAAARLPGQPVLVRALEFLRGPGLAGLSDGEYELDGRLVYAIVQRYVTAPAAEPRFEVHRRYADVQFVAAGAEVIGWAPAGRFRELEAYDEKKDIAFGRAADWTPVLLRAGELAVLFPEDAHAPRLAAGNPGPVLKIVIKVAV